jgi:hypothetical protein
MARRTTYQPPPVRTAVPTTTIPNISPTVPRPTQHTVVPGPNGQVVK